MSTKQIIRKKGLVENSSKVVVGNQLITAAQKISNRGQRLIKIIIAQMDDRKDDVLPTVTFVKYDLAKLLRLQNTGRRFELLDETLREVKSAVITIQEEDGIVYTSWFRTAKLFKNGNVRLKLENDLKPYLLQLKKQWTKLPLEPYLDFKGEYTIRIFDFIMKDFGLDKSVSKSKDGTKYVSIEYSEMRTALGLDDFNTGKQLKLGRWPDFRRKVLEPAVEEITEKTDYTISWEASQGRRRKTEAIIFHIMPDSYKVKTKLNAKGITPPKDIKHAFGILEAMLEECSQILKNKIKTRQAELLKTYVIEDQKVKKKRPGMKLTNPEILEQRAIDAALEEFREEIEIAYRKKR